MLMKAEGSDGNAGKLRKQFQRVSEKLGFEGCGDNTFYGHSHCFMFYEIIPLRTESK